MQKVAPGNSEYGQMPSMKTAVFTEKTGEFGIAIATIYGLLCFSSHLQVINKVYEQCRANWHSINYSIYIILPYYVIKQVFV